MSETIEIKTITLSDINDVAKIHASVFPGSLIPKLGLNIIKIKFKCKLKKIIRVTIPEINMRIA